MNKKYINLFAGGVIAFGSLGNLANLGRTIDLTIPTVSPIATVKPILINPNILGKFDKIELKFTNKRGELSKVKVTAKDATSISVDSEGVVVKVTVTADTHFRRKFWGKSSLAEISIGDSVDVIGKWVNETKTEIKANVIRDLSIQKRFGVFFGTIKTITDTGFVMTTIQRGEETVTLDSSSKLINRKGDSLTSADIQVGHKIRVRGLWNSTAFTITEVTEVKDFDLPAQAGLPPFATEAP